MKQVFVFLGSPRGDRSATLGRMAWRIAEQVVRGELDSRERGRIIGRIWIVGETDPFELDLEGCPWRDLAGHVLHFANPKPEAGDCSGLARCQQGVTGDMTASRKVKVPDCSMEEFEELYKARKPIPFRWGNSLYLEWFSRSNGRVVIETVDFELTLDGTAAWVMSDEDEAAQRLANGKALTEFMDQLGKAAGDREDPDDDAPRSRAEAEADAEAARMDLLLDRVEARIAREGFDEDRFDQIMEEERARMRRENGEPEEEELTPEQEAEQHAWIEEMNAISEEVSAEMESEKWKGREPRELRRPPLVERCSDLAVKVHRDVQAGAWVSEDDQREHPIHEIVHGTMSASAKLAGALGMDDEDEHWPPPAIFAGDTLVRLKKARGYLRDVLAGLDSADEDELATPDWRAATRREVAEILGEVQRLIAEVREVLRNDEEE